MPQGHQVVDVVIILGTDDNVHHGVKDGAFLHRWFSRRRLDIVLNLLGHLFHPVHIQDLLPDLILILPDALVSVDLLSIQVGHDLHRALPKDIALEDVRQGSLGVD